MLSLSCGGLSFYERANQKCFFVFMFVRAIVCMAVSLRHAARTQGKGGATINALAAKGHIERDSGVLTVRRRPRVRVRACTHITCARVQLTGTAAEVGQAWSR